MTREECPTSCVTNCEDLVFRNGLTSINVVLNFRFYFTKRFFILMLTSEWYENNLRQHVCCTHLIYHFQLKHFDNPLTKHWVDIALMEPFETNLIKWF